MHSDYDEFFRAHFGRAQSLAHLITGSRPIGQEIAQEAMLAVHKSWDSLERPEAFLRTVVVNLARSVQRRQIRERLHLQRLRGREPVTAVPAIDETWGILRRMPPRQRTVLVLRYYEDLSVADIADLLGQPVGTVKSTLSRAASRLKEALND